MSEMGFELSLEEKIEIARKDKEKAAKQHADYLKYGAGQPPLQTPEQERFNEEEP